MYVFEQVEINEVNCYLTVLSYLRIIWTKHFNTRENVAESWNTPEIPTGIKQETEKINTKREVS